MEPETVAKLDRAYRKALQALRLTPEQALKTMCASPQLSKPTFELTARALCPNGPEMQAEKIDQAYSTLCEKIQRGEDFRKALASEGEPSAEQLAAMLNYLRQLPAVMGRTLRRIPSELQLPRLPSTGRRPALNDSLRENAVAYMVKRVNAGIKLYQAAREWCDRHPGKAHRDTLAKYYADQSKTS